MLFNFSDHTMAAISKLISPGERCNENTLMYPPYLERLKHQDVEPAVMKIPCIESRNQVQLINWRPIDPVLRAKCILELFPGVHAIETNV